MLLSGGANKNMVSEHGDTSLAIATRANDKKSVKRLLQSNVKVITENKVRHTDRHNMSQLYGFTHQN